MYLAKVMTPRSLPEIGRRFGNRDHTTVLHAVRKIEEMARADYAWRRSWNCSSACLTPEAASFGNGPFADACLNSNGHPPA